MVRDQCQSHIPGPAAERFPAGEGLLGARPGAGEEVLQVWRPGPRTREEQGAAGDDPAVNAVWKRLLAWREEEEGSEEKWQGGTGTRRWHGTDRGGGGSGGSRMQEGRWLGKQL